MQMSSEHCLGAEQVSEAGLRDDGVQQGVNQLAQEAPETRPGQAA